MKTVPTERALIASLRRQTKNLPAAQVRSVRLGIGDDCAILRIPARHEMLLTTDLSLETTHFRRDWHPPESVGHRCLARGLSDLAAMGAHPLAAFLSLALPRELMTAQRNRPSWRDRFFAGLLALAKEHRLPLAGGDTAQSPAGIRAGNTRSANTGPESTSIAIADIVLVGSAPRNRALLRSAAKAGDRIYVTGHLGGAAAELAALAAHPRRFAKVTHASRLFAHPHLFPQPRVAVGESLLARRLATAAIDISDGLSTDLDHLCEESGLAAVIDVATLPIHPLAASEKNSLHLALHGGEDYELLFTASAQTKIPRSIAGVPITCIGQMQPARRKQPRMQLLRRVGTRPVLEPLPTQGWEHYRER
ncbi:MAG TPA: thiamine-phosphate kinase [Acidobacteriaceae bacterium]|jgi:thiamine-monophosphate kinase|nr:thiamine-phosphate kinase [Acidobacteriaceae bacterium]